MRFLYDAFFLVFAALYLPYLVVKRKGHADFSQKLGNLPSRLLSIEKPVWIHAVSVGEAVLASKLAARIKQDHPGVPVVVSTTTDTGGRMARSTGRNSVDMVFFYPMDLSFVVSKVLDIVNPRLYVMIETEIWPNMLTALKKRNIPVAVVNGRLSDTSFSNYRKIAPLVRRILGCVNVFCMRSAEDALRVKKLGAPGGSVFVTGNIKLDEENAVLKGKGTDKEDLGFGREDPVIVAGSTHVPEEQLLIEAFSGIKKNMPEARLVIAPRHIERTDAIKVYLDRQSLKYRLFSEMKDARPGGRDCDVLVVDTIGHLKDIYNAATVAFIGGSIASKGGQNPIEAAIWGKPVLFGPNMDNFRDVARLFLDGGAAVQVSDASGLFPEMERLLADDARRREMGKNALGILLDNSGALAQTVERLGPFMGLGGGSPLERRSG